MEVGRGEPNEVNEDQEQQEQEARNVRNRRPSPKRRAANAAKTTIKTAVKVAKKVLQVFAAMPLPVKIGIAIVVAVIIIVVVILDAEAAQNSSHVTESIDHVIKNNENLSDEAKESYEKTGSLLKFPLEELIKMYNYYVEEGEFSGTDIRKNYMYVIGKNEVQIREGTGTNDTSSTNASGDMESLVKKAVEMAKEPKIQYSMSGRQTAETMEELNAIKVTDCSGFVHSIFKACLGINVGYTTDTMAKRAREGEVDSGWKVSIHEIGDGSALKPGDILLREGGPGGGHVGIYVGEYGEKNHVHHTSGGLGPKNTNYANGYRYYIRYEKQ